MKYTIEFGGVPQDLTLTLTGELDPAEIRMFVQELMESPDYRAGMLILADISGLDTSAITDEAYESFSDAIGARDFRFPAKAIAIVAPEGRTFNDAMRHRAYVGGSKSTREVFRTREEATAWLAAQR